MGNAFLPTMWDSEVDHPAVPLATERQLALQPVTRTICSICNTSFMKITRRDNKKSKRNLHHKMSTNVDPASIHNFYNAFYARLERTDTSHLNFESILNPLNSRNVRKSQADVRGAILLRIIRFVLNVQSESEEVRVFLLLHIIITIITLSQSIAPDPSVQYILLMCCCYWWCWIS